MKNWKFLGCALAIMGLVGCGDDDGTDPTPGTDAGMNMMTDSGPPAAVDCNLDSIPDSDGRMGACCFRKENGADSDSPEFRISALALTSPATLANQLVGAVLNGAINEERFNWLIRVGIDGTTANIQTGYGAREDDASFSFTMDGAPPAGGDPARWNPINIAASIDGEAISADPQTGSFAVPVLNDDGGLLLELPLNALQVEMATMSAERSCIGGVTRRRDNFTFDTTQGVLNTYILVEDTVDSRLEAPPINSRLCNFIGRVEGDEPCTDTPRSEWDVPPDALCEDGACSDSCDPMTDCNAWHITGGFAAHGVEIAD